MTRKANPLDVPLYVLLAAWVARRMAPRIRMAGFYSPHEHKRALLDMRATYEEGVVMPKSSKIGQVAWQLVLEWFEHKMSLLDKEIAASLTMFVYREGKGGDN